MRKLKELIEVWETLKEIDPRDDGKAYCAAEIKRLKRHNFYWDLFDIACKAFGILGIMLGVFLFYYHAVHDSLFGIVLDCGTIYYGFKISKGLEK